MTPERRQVTAESFELWRDGFSTRLRAAEELHQPAVAIDHDALGDMLSVIQEGGFIMSKVMDDPGLMARYVRLLRTHIELVYGVSGTGAMAATASTALSG